MDKTWVRKSSKLEVIGRCGGDEKNRMTTQNWQKSHAKKQNKKTSTNSKVKLRHNFKAWIKFDF